MPPYPLLQTNLALLVACSALNTAFLAQSRCQIFIKFGLLIVWLLAAIYCNSQRIEFDWSRLGITFDEQFLAPAGLKSWFTVHYIVIFFALAVLGSVVALSLRHGEVAVDKTNELRSKRFSQLLTLTRHSFIVFSAKVQRLSRQPLFQNTAEGLKMAQTQ